MAKPKDNAFINSDLSASYEITWEDVSAIPLRKRLWIIVMRFFDRFSVKQKTVFLGIILIAVGSLSLCFYIKPTEKNTVPSTPIEGPSKKEVSPIQAKGDGLCIALNRWDQSSSLTMGPSAQKRCSQKVMRNK